MPEPGVPEQRKSRHRSRPTLLHPLIARVIIPDCILKINHTSRAFYRCSVPLRQLTTSSRRKQRRARFIAPLQGQWIHHSLPRRSRLQNAVSHPSPHPLNQGRSAAYKPMDKSFTLPRYNSMKLSLNTMSNLNRVRHTRSIVPHSLPIPPIHYRLRSQLLCVNAGFEGGPCQFS